MAQILHRSAKGKMIDMNKMASQNELAVAVSNVKVNARGDELGPGGQIIRNNMSHDMVAPASNIPAEQYTARPSVAENIEPKKPNTPQKPIESQKVVMTQPVDASPFAITHPAPTVNLEKSNKGK
jgi:hypothetical protein